MSPIDAHIILAAFGQSNCRDEVIQGLLGRLPFLFLGKVREAHGDTEITEWVSGSFPGSLTKGPHYLTDIYAGDGSSPLEVAVSDYPGATHIWVPWFQGENDADDGMSQAEYEARLQFLFDSLATDYPDHTLKTVGFLPWNVLADSDPILEGKYDAIRLALGVVCDITVETNDLSRSDNVHLDLESQAIAGVRAAKALVKLHSLEPEGVAIKWTAPGGDAPAPTGYNIYTSTDGGSTFSFLADAGDALSATIDAVSGDVVRVTGYTDAGEGATSGTLTIP